MTGRGRPSTGVRVAVRIPADVLAILDTEAELCGVSRAEIVREALSRYAATWGSSHPETENP